MPTTAELLQSIRAAAAGLSLTELTALHPTLARRSAQRLVSRMVADGLILAKGEGRAHRYYAAASAAPAVTEKDALPAFIPLSADSKDILAYIDQPPEASKPVGYQRELIEHGKAARGKAAIETLMILNHKAAIEFLVENTDTAGFNRYTLMNLHGMLANGLLPNPADEGRIRQHAVDISLSPYHPLSTPQQLDDLLNVLLDKANRINDPFEQSFFMRVHLPYLQPFADINTRTSRLAANLPLFRANLCPLTFVDVPEHAYSRAILGVYEMARMELLRDLYVWAYERSAQEYLAIRQNMAEPDPLRLAWRELIKEAIHAVVTQPELEPLAVIRRAVIEVPAEERESVQALVVEELRRLHEGVLARHGLRPLEFR